MGGSGGGGAYYGGASEDDLKRETKKKLEDLEKQFRTDLQPFLDDKLADFNDRDKGLVDEKLADIKGLLGDEIDYPVTLRMGGSVAKHTYVDGVSDVDALFVIRSGEAKKIQPSDLMKDSVDRLKSEINDAEITLGSIAITLKYKDGLEIQLVPALKEKGDLKVPSWGSDSWSKIEPVKFTSALTKRNEECDSKLVPVIKLAKGINANLPEVYKLSGYHVESMAISAFRHYEGACTTAHMLPLFFEEMSRRVLKPIRDKTGQSIHVDSYLKNANSEERKKRSHLLSRIAKRMKTASAAQSISQWKELFGED